MTKQLCFLLLASAFWFAPAAEGQDALSQLKEDEKLKQESEPGRNKRLAEEVDRELSLLKRFTKLSDDAIAQLTSDLDSLVESTTKPYPGLIQRRILPDEVLDAIVKSAIKAVGDQKSLAPYLDDLATRRTFADEIAMQTYVYYVDCFTGLSSKQWAAVRQAGSRLHRDGELNLYMLVHRDHRVPEADLEQLTKILSDEQLRWLKDFTPFWRGGKTREELTRALRVIADVKIQQLDAEVALSKSQRQKLEFVCKKTVVPYAVQRKLAAEDFEQRRAKAVAGQGRIENKDVAKMRKISTARIPYLFPEERWQTFVTSTLSDEQLKKWTQFTEQRHEAATDAQANDLSWCLSKLELTGAQQIAVHRVLRRGVQSRGVKLENAFFNEDLRIRSVTDEEFVAAIGEENWAKLDWFIKLPLTLP